MTTASSSAVTENRFRLAMVGGLMLVAAVSLAGGMWLVAFGIVAGLLFFRLLLAGSWPLLMVWLIGLPTCFVFANNILMGIPFLKAERGVFVLLALILILLAVFKRLPAVRLDTVERSFWLLLGLFGLSMLFAARGKDFSDVLKQDVSFLFDGYFMPFLAYSIVRRSQWTEQRLKWFFYLACVAGLYQTATAILQLYAGVTIFYPEYTPVLHLGEGRATGVFSGAAEFGPVAATFFLMVAALTANNRDKLISMLMSAAMLVVFVAVVLCKTRAAWLGLLVSLGFIYVHDVRSRPLMNIFLGVGIVASAMVMPLVLDLDKLEQRLMDPVPVLNRLAAWSTAINMAIQNPLGVGFSRYGFGEAKEAYFVSFGDVSSLWAAELSVPHNEFIHILALTGFPGLILFIRVIIQLHQTLKAIWCRSELTQECRTLALYTHAAILGGIVINGFFVDLGKFLYLYTQLFALAGVAVVTSARPESQIVHQGNNQ